MRRFDRRPPGGARTTSRPVRRERWMWALPAIVALVVLARPGKLATLTGAVVVAAIVLLASRAPGRALLALTAAFPFAPSLLAWLYRVGVPRIVVRGLGSWKEALALGLLVAALRDIRATGRRLDRLDRWVLAYVGMVTVYLVLASLFAPRGQPVLPFGDRLLGWRENAGFPLLFFAARHAPITRVERDRWVRVALVVAVLVALPGIWQYLQPDSFRRFAVDTIGYPRYLVDVLGGSATLQWLLDGLRARPIRAGSVLFSQFSLGDYLIVALSIGLERLTRRLAGALLAVAVVVVGLGIVVTFTRACLVGALVALAVAVRPTGGWPAAARTRVALAFVLLAVLAAPLLAGSRVAGKQNAAESNSGHISETRHGIDVMIHHPLGTGLGTANGTGTRLLGNTGPTGARIAANMVVGVGDELGVVAMALFLAVTFGALVGLWRAGREGDALCRALFAAGVGLCVGGLTHHPWADFTVAWTYWAAAGMAIGVARSGAGAGVAAGVGGQSRNDSS